MEGEQYERNFRQSKRLCESGMGDLLPLTNPDSKELVVAGGEKDADKWYGSPILGTERRISLAEIQESGTSKLTNHPEEDGPDKGLDFTLSSQNDAPKKRLESELKRYQETFLRQRRRLEKAILQRSSKE